MSVLKEVDIIKLLTELKEFIGILSRDELNHNEANSILLDLIAGSKTYHRALGIAIRYTDERRALDIAIRHRNERQK